MLYNFFKKDIEKYIGELEKLNGSEFDLECDALRGDDYIDHIDRILVWEGSHGDRRAKELFILSKISYIRKIINSDKDVVLYKNKGLDEDDLLQTGIIGAIETIEKYDFRVDVKVRTFLACRVRFAIKNAYRCYGTITVSREANSIYSRFSKKIDPTEEKYSNESLDGVEKEIGVDKRKIFDAILAVKYSNSILCYDNEGYIELDNKSMEKNSYSVIRDFEDKMDRVFNYKIVIDSFSLLSEKEKYVMEEFFIRDKTQKEISKDIGCSITTVGKIKKRAIEKIRKNVIDDSEQK